PDDIDVARANGLFLFENLRALVDHRIEAAFENLVVGNSARVSATLLDEVLDDLLGDGRGLGVPVLVVIIIALAVLLAAAIPFAQAVAHLLALRLFLAPADRE